MKAKFLEFVSHHALFQPRGKVLLAVSGGIDSMVMLHLFQSCKFDFGVAHCNFGLRGGESDADASFVESFCKSASIQYHSKQFDTKNYAREKGISTQMAAREMRYDWFHKILIEFGYSAVATAHHLDDSFETVILNLTKGTGLPGVAGISIRSGHVVRPMLSLSRNEIEEYAKANSIQWREDSSNASNDYQRNLIRNEVVPVLKSINPALEETYAKSAERLRAASELVEEYRKILAERFVRMNGDQIHINKNVLEPFTFKSGVLWELVKDYGFNYPQCEEIAEALNGQPGKRFFSQTNLLVIDRDSLIVQSRNESWEQTSISKESSELQLGPWNLKIEYPANVEVSRDACGASLNLSELRFPLVWRRWSDGDSFIPLGMTTRKKVSDFLIDNKVSVADKQAVTVLESNGEIVWLVGYRIDNRFRITAETKSMIYLSVSPRFK